MENVVLKPEDCCREVIGKTPHGGVRMVAHFFDENGKPCLERNAKTIQILEYDNNDVCIFSVISR